MEIASNGLYTFRRALLCFGDTVGKHALIGIEPVLERNSGESDIIKEVILVSWKKEVAVLVYGANFLFSHGSLDAVTAGLIMAVDYFVADHPNEVPLFPDAA